MKVKQTINYIMNNTPGTYNNNSTCCRFCNMVN